MCVRCDAQLPLNCAGRFCSRGQVTATEVILTTGASFVRSTRAIYATLSAAQRASLLLSLIHI